MTEEGKEMLMRASQRSLDREKLTTVTLASK